MRLLRAAVRILRFLPTSQALAIGAAWGIAIALAWTFGWLAFLEEPLGDRLWRASQAGEPTVTSWVVFMDKASVAKGHPADDAETWKTLLARAREEAVSAVVILDERAPGAVALALQG